MDAGDVTPIISWPKVRIGSQSSQQSRPDSNFWLRPRSWRIHRLVRPLNWPALFKFSEPNRCGWCCSQRLSRPMLSKMPTLRKPRNDCLIGGQFCCVGCCHRLCCGLAADATSNEELAFSLLSYSLWRRTFLHFLPLPVFILEENSKSIKSICLIFLTFFPDLSLTSNVEIYFDWMY